MLQAILMRRIASGEHMFLRLSSARDMLELDAIPDLRNTKTNDDAQ
jgi:hypothetical protein